MIKNSFIATKQKRKGKLSIGNEGTHTIRKHQDYILTNYSDERYFIMNEPPGSGKSTTIKFVMAKRLHRDNEHKLIICIPQTLIIKSFKDINLRYTDGAELDWAIGHDLCNGINLGRKVKFLEDFLKGKKSSNDKEISDRILITTHANMSRIIQHYGKFIGELFSNTTLVIDEAHHILFPETEESDSCNMIGKLIRELTTFDDPTTSIWLPTATFFRGDRGLILPEEVISKFTYHFLPLDRHWEENIKHIKSFEFNFVTYTDIFDSVKEVITKFGKKKYVIYCPYVGNLLNGIDKYIFRDRLISIIREVWSDCNIMDLITTNNRDEKKKIIFDNKKAGNIDIILALKIFDEGSDWLYAEQILDLAPSNSLRVLGQRHGRLWRDLPKKTHIGYNVFLPYISKYNIEVDRRSHLSNSYNAFTASLLLRETIEPIPYIKRGRGNKKNGTRTYNCFIEEVSNEGIRQDIMDNIIMELIFLKESKGEPTLDDSKETIKTVLNNFNIRKEMIDDITIHIAKMLRRDSIITDSKDPGYKKGLDISFMLEAGFDKIWENKIFDKLLVFGTDQLGIETFKEFREIFSRSLRIINEDHVKTAEKLAKENGGKIPTFKWLSENGYIALGGCIMRLPELFDHLEQEKLVLASEVHIETAAKLAKNNNDKIPSHSWLIKKGYGAFAQYLINHPELFTNLKQENFFISREKHIKTAEKLAKKNGGKVPSFTWLENNGYMPLSSYFTKHRKVFSHLKQDNSFVKKEDYVKTAEKLAKKNGGKVPNPTWLKNNGYGNLYGCMYRNPESFSHLKKVSLRATHKDHIKTAEKLIKENGGKIPSNTWLNKNGYNAFAQYFNNHSELF
jgi:superfamily II DNA or RNA helicase